MISYQNIINGNGISITLTGMAIVFSGLILMSLYIFFLPKALVFFQKVLSVYKYAPEASSVSRPIVRQPETPREYKDDPDDIASVIGIVLHLELEKSHLVDNQQITIIRDEYHVPVWGLSRKLRVTPSRRS